MIDSVLAAKQIRKELKENFKGTKFSVLGKNYSMGNSVYVSWTNGPAFKCVKNLIKKYERGYEFENVREDIAQAMFVHFNRDIGMDIQLEAFSDLKEKHHDFKNIKDIEDYSESLQQYVQQFIRSGLWDCDLTSGYSWEDLKKAKNIKDTNKEFDDYISKLSIKYDNFATSLGELMNHLSKRDCDKFNRENLEILKTMYDCSLHIYNCSDNDFILENLVKFTGFDD